MDEELWDKVDALRSIGGDIRSSRLRWYANIIADRNNGKYLKLYWSQVSCIRYRMGEHILGLGDPKSKSKSLHYFVARREGRECDFITVGIDDEIVTALCNEGQ